MPHIISIINTINLSAPCASALARSATTLHADRHGNGGAARGGASAPATTTLSGSGGSGGRHHDGSSRNSSCGRGHAKRGQRYGIETSTAHTHDDCDGLSKN